MSEFLIRQKNLYIQPNFPPSLLLFSLLPPPSGAAAPATLLPCHHLHRVSDRARSQPSCHRPPAAAVDRRKTNPKLCRRTATGRHIWATESPYFGSFRPRNRFHSTHLTSLCRSDVAVDVSVAGTVAGNARKFRRSHPIVASVRPFPVQPQPCHHQPPPPYWSPSSGESIPIGPTACLAAVRCRRRISFVVAPAS